MRDTIVVCGHSLINGGLQRATGMTSLALAELGYRVVLLLQKTKPLHFAHAGRLLPADLTLPEVHRELACARLILDYNWNGFAPGEPRAALHRYMTDRHVDRLVPTVHNTSTVGRYLDIYRDFGVLHRLPAIVCVSRAVYAAAEKRYGPLPNARVLHNAISPEFAEQAKISVPNPHSRPYFLFVGRSSSVEHKGMDYLIKAWSAAGLGTTHDLILLGESVPVPALEAIIERENVSASVRHKPFTTNPTAWMRYADALVLASRHEGMSLVLPEALYTGTPCIATRCGASEEMIHDGVNGFLLDVGDVSGFASAMMRIAHQPDLRAKLAANASVSAEPFLFSAHIRAWEQLLTDLNVPARKVPVPSTDEKNEDRSPTVSVQLPIFNKVRYLRECLDSIIAQTFNDYEVICVDDGSTDGSWEILQKYAACDSRFRLYRHETNLGTMAARKRCFQEARGEFMAFVDADDTVRPEWLAKLVDAARREDADFVQCAAEVSNDENIAPHEIVKVYQKAYIPIDPITLEGGKVFHGCAWPIKTNLWLSLVARTVYRMILPYIPDEPVPHGNDTILIFMMTFFAGKFVSVPEQLYCYRANDTSSNLVIPSPQVALSHIRSRALIIRIANDFLLSVAPGCNRGSTPLSRFEQNSRAYTQTLIKRCLDRYPEAKELLESAYVEHFTDLTISVASKEAVPGAMIPPPSKQSLLRRLRSLAVRLWTAPQLRRAGLFFSIWYLERYPDVKAAGVDPLKHFLVHGAKEGRDPNPLFDTSWYLSVNPDVAASGCNPLVHYFRHGWREGRSPSNCFDIAEYMRLRPDVAEKGVEPLGHYLIHGIAEGVRFPVQKHAVGKELAASVPKSLAATKLEGPSHSAKSSHVAAKPRLPILKLSTVEELADWYERYPDFVAFREKFFRTSFKDYQHSDLKFIQDLAMVDFMTRYLRPGAKVLDIGGGMSRLLIYFKDRFEGWLLDKFEGVGNGPVKIPDMPCKIVPDYIGAFSKDLPSGYFDFVFSISVFEHIGGDAVAVNAITDDIDRLLKYDGLQAHCMDCRFPPGGPLDLPKQRRFINHVIERHGFQAQYIYDHYRDPAVFSMSGRAYDRFWKKACNNRPHELDGLPFNIFLAAGSTLQKSVWLQEEDSKKHPSRLSVAASQTPVESGRHCNICGSNKFIAAWAGRLNNGILPRCADCYSCERHRVIRRAFEEMPSIWFAGTELLQFSKDPSVPTDRFGKVVISVFKGQNHLDLQDIDRPDSSYHWVVCNHVLEHVQDDRKAMHELLRIVKPSGGLIFSYPSPLTREKTEDWGWADEKRAWHYREYGSDAILTRFFDAFNGWYVLSYRNIDPVTETPDICYFATCDSSKVDKLRDSPNWDILISPKILPSPSKGAMSKAG